MRRLALWICLAASAAAGQSATDKLLQEAQKAPTLEKDLRVLTDEIGGRVPGTPAMERAVQWSVDAFKAAGADSVNTEKARIASSWAEGNTQVEVVSPAPFHVQAVSLTWTAPSVSPVQGRRVIDVGFGREQDFRKAGDLKGAIALVHSTVMKSWDDLFEEYFRQLPLIAAAKASKASAVAFISTRPHDLLYRHIGSFTESRRTIRFALFTGQEQGTLGSWAYVRDHRRELDNVVAMLTWDAGTGRTTGFSVGGRKDIVDPLTRLLAPIKQFDAGTLTTDATLGTDHVDFLLEGVPTLVANQEEANYLINYHASSDTCDKVDLPQLRKHIAIAAYVTYAIADSPERLGLRQNRAEIEALIREAHLDDQLKGLDMWSDWESGKRGRSK